ncbi:mitogen-activated protein kinase kinase kinase 20-like [Juglans microcarpa x Juglans regia]|uniref:mitogen-activated protein kinase kinase kinase 20-like n=1 Tax=Juglans microcarpa x Juglans regia TaxID=2249226 RepID=UPI001B7E314B|nr:mitogen-activated protein kinase kinase kinase 20-like [Juglans microcarpa x Juglans regia]
MVVLLDLAFFRHKSSFSFFRISMASNACFSFSSAAASRASTDVGNISIAWLAKERVTVEVSVSGSLQKEKEVLNNEEGSPYVIDCFGEEITTQEKGEMVYNLLLEYASKGTLANSIEKSDGCQLPKTDVKRYTWSILKGLSHIHDCGFIHCDLKPENVLLVPAISPSSNFVAKIGDFGL